MHISIDYTVRTKKTTTKKKSKKKKEGTSMTIQFIYNCFYIIL